MKNKKKTKGGNKLIDINKFVNFHLHYLINLKLFYNNIFINNVFTYILDIYEELIDKDILEEPILRQPITDIDNIDEILTVLYDNINEIKCGYFNEKTTKEFLKYIFDKEISINIDIQINNKININNLNDEEEKIILFMYIFIINIYHFGDFIKGKPSYITIIKTFITFLKEYVNKKLIQTIIKFKAEKLANVYLEYKDKQPEFILDIKEIFKVNIDNFRTKFIEKYDIIVEETYKDKLNINEIKKDSIKNYKNLAILIKTLNYKFNIYNYGSEMYLLNFFRNIDKDEKYINCKNFFYFTKELKNGIIETEALKITYDLFDYFEKIFSDIMIYLYIFYYKITTLYNDKELLLKEFENISKYFIYYFNNELANLQNKETIQKIEDSYQDFEMDKYNKDLNMELKTNPKYNQYIKQIKYNIYKYKYLYYGEENCNQKDYQLFDKSEIYIYIIKDIVRINFDDYYEKQILDIEEANIIKKRKEYEEMLKKAKSSKQSNNKYFQSKILEIKKKKEINK